jgi:hypothetical protein
MAPRLDSEMPNEDAASGAQATAQSDSSEQPSNVSIQQAQIAVEGTMDLLRRAGDSGLFQGEPVQRCIEALGMARALLQGPAFTSHLIEPPPLNFQILRHIALKARGGSSGASFRQSTNRVYNWLEDAVKVVLKAIKDEPPSTQIPLETDFVKFADRVSVARRLYEISRAQDDIEQSAVRAREVVSEAEEVAGHVREVAGEAAEHELGSEYSKLAVSERRSSWFWSGMVIASLLGSAIAAGYLLRSATHFNGLGELGRLALTLPILGLAVFAARSAGHHRDNYKWATFTAVQLKTIRAYSDDLTYEARCEIRRGLGLKIFAGHPEPGADGEDLVVSLPTHAVDSATSLVKAIAEATRRT